MVASGSMVPMSCAPSFVVAMGLCFLGTGGWCGGRNFWFALSRRWAAAHEQKHASGGGEFAGMVADGAVGPICGLSWSVWTREGGRVRPWVVVSSLVAVWVHGVARAERTDFL